MSGEKQLSVGKEKLEIGDWQKGGWNIENWGDWEVFKHLGAWECVE